MPARGHCRWRVATCTTTVSLVLILSKDKPTWWLVVRRAHHEREPNTDAHGNEEADAQHPTAEPRPTHPTPPTHATHPTHPTHETHPTQATVLDHATHPSLRRVLTFRDLFLYYVVTGFSLRWIAVAAAAGPSAIVIWIIAALGFFVPLVFSTLELSSRYPEEG